MRGQPIATAVLLLAALLLTACAGFGQVEHVSSLSPEQVRAMNQINIYTDDSDVDYTTLGEVKGLSCKGSPWGGAADESAAMNQLKIKAVQLDANAIVHPACSHHSGTDWGNNCWESWVCVGTAVRVD